MKRIPLFSTVVVLALAYAAQDAAGAQFWPPLPVPDISGSWYMNGDRSQRCQVIQTRLDGRALFINEHGSQASGTVQGDQVWIPDWSDGEKQGLVGVIRGPRIVWPNGSFWAR